MMVIVPLLKGFAVSAGLIMAIGAQNAFVLKQGLKRHHLFLTATTCFLCDGILIILGVKGVSLFISDNPTLENILRWGGILFLLGYASRSFYTALHPKALINHKKPPGKKLATFLAVLAFTFFNPHTYVDIFLILGSVGADQRPEEHLPFIVGALISSFIWFYGLAYGASALSPLLKSPRAWQVIDLIMGILMTLIAISLIV